MRVLFVGESWLGSCARSLKEALQRETTLVFDEINEDLCFPKSGVRWIRLMNRLTRAVYYREFRDGLLSRINEFKPDVLVTYKGMPFKSDLVARIGRLGVRTVNVYPDCSPHAHGDEHRRAVGVYDLVISTKPFHPGAWTEVYGYRNRCEFVPQGYDPRLHLVETPASDHEFDVVLVATWREEYARLMRATAAGLVKARLKVGIAGNGWERRRDGLPEQWSVLGPVHGRSYVETLRKARICIAPLTRDVVVGGLRQPGDVDTTRTYELAAAHCFFVHCRTGYVRSLYDEETEVPMYDDDEELAAHIQYYLPRAAERSRMAASAHRRAVPAYSLDSRAASIVRLLETL